MTKVMTKTLIAVLAAAPMLAACPAGIPGTTPGASTLNITGNVIKGTVPFENATVRLIEKINNVTSNREVRQADKQGNFTFEKVPGGTYRVAFDRANLAEVKDKATVYHQAGSDTYGFYTTTEFVIMGSEGSRTIPPMNVAWTPNLSPSVDGSAKAPVTFSWNAAPDAKSYKVRIASSTNNTVFTSDTLQASATSFTWDGMASGAKVPAGSYVWSVNVDLDGASGGTNVSKFTLQ